MESSRVDRAAQDLLELIYDCVQPQRKSPKRHLPQLRLLILNLLKTRHLSLDKMAVRFDAGAYSEMRHFSFRVLIQLLMHALIEMKWLSKRPGWTQRIGGAVSRVCIEAPLERWLNENFLGIQEEDIERVPPRSALVIKDGEKEPIPLATYVKGADPAVVNKIDRMENALSRINENLERSHLDLFIDEQEEQELTDALMAKGEGKGITLDRSKKYVRRVFNNSSLYQGGRFYGAFWQGIPKEYRRLITINGHQTIELDYSSLHIHLLYARMQRHCSLEDNYVFGKLTEAFRPVTKRLMMMLINAGTEQKAIDAAKKQGLFDNGWPLGIKNDKEYVEEIRQHHDPIQQFFGSGIGVELQYQDSEIARSVMLELLPEPCLTVHDSFIVRTVAKGQLEAAMYEAFRLTTGTEPDIKHKILEVTETGEEQIVGLIEDELSGYSRRLQKWREKHNWKYLADGGTHADIPILQRPNTGGF